MKRCTKCGLEKSLDEFYKARKPSGVRAARGGGGVESVCKKCRSDIRNPALAERRKAEAEARISGVKVCGKCEQAKPLSSFHKRRASPDGLAYKCAECVVADCSEWRAKNPGSFVAWDAKNRQKRAEYRRARYEANKALLNQRYSAWAKENKHIVNALVAKRNAAKFRATPSWADLSAMRAIYAEAARVTLMTGVRHEVDHYYPLQGKLVCGLHCESNLQILTKVENIRKSNRMPESIHEPQRYCSVDEGNCSGD